MLSSTSCRRPLLELQIPNEHVQIQKEKENIFVAYLRPQKEPNLHPRMEKPNRFCATLWCSMNRNSDRSGSEWVGVRTGIHWGGWDGSEWIQLNKPPPGGTQQMFIRGGSARKSHPLSFYISLFTKKVPLSYTFYWQMLPLSQISLAFYILQLVKSLPLICLNPEKATTTRTSFICMTIQVHTVLQKLF